MSEPLRPFEEQTPLERTLRSHLWHPVELLKNYDQAMKSLVKDKAYREAAELQTRAAKAKLEVESWENLLRLYEDEFKTLTPQTAKGEVKL